MRARFNAALDGKRQDGPLPNTDVGEHLQIIAASKANWIFTDHRLQPQPIIAQRSRSIGIYDSAGRGTVFVRDAQNPFLQIEAGFFL